MQDARITPEGLMWTPVRYLDDGSRSRSPGAPTPRQAGITVAGQRRDCTGLPLDVERVDSVVVGPSHAGPGGVKGRVFGVASDHE